LRRTRKAIDDAKTGFGYAFIIFTSPFISMRILGLSSSVPRHEYTTQEMIENFPCELPESVRQNALNLGVSKRAFIHSVHRRDNSEIMLSETELVDLCIDACKNVVEKAGISLSRIGYFITTYDVSPILSPGLSQLLVRKIGFDPYVKHVNAQGIASTAFPKSLQLAEDHLAAHPEDNVLICVSGVSSYWFQNQVRGLNGVLEIGRINEIEDSSKRQMEIRKWIATMEYFLFGDAVVAAVVANQGVGVTVKKTAEVTNVKEADCFAGYSRLSSLPESFNFGFHSYLDKEIPNLGVKYTSLALSRLLGDCLEETIKVSKKWAVHTGSEKILDTLSKHLGVDAEKLKESHDVLKQHGNLSGASLPFIVEKIISGNKLSRGDVVLMVGYGWGFSAAASLLEV
jgi:predicted naringenin-chalcone synthase